MQRAEDPVDAWTVELLPVGSPAVEVRRGEPPWSACDRHVVQQRAVELPAQPCAGPHPQALLVVAGVADLDRLALANAAPGSVRLSGKGYFEGRGISAAGLARRIGLAIGKRPAAVRDRRVGHEIDAHDSHHARVQARVFVVGRDLEALPFCHREPEM